MASKETTAMANKRRRRDAGDPTDSTEQPVAGTTIQCRSDSIDNSSAAQPAKSSAEQPDQVFAFPLPDSANTMATADSSAGDAHPAVQPATL